MIRAKFILLLNYFGTDVVLPLLQISTKYILGLIFTAYLDEVFNWKIKK